jgi:hypothetical protein
MWVPALRRFLQLFLVIGVGTAVVSAAFGLLLGSTLERSISLGFYLVGCFLLIGAFFYGIRGPVRPSSPDQQDPGILTGIGARRIRWATREEQEESINSSAVFLTLGLVLIILGVVSDSRHTLF